MAKEQKHFLRRVQEIWKIQFPFLKPVDVNEVPKIPKGCNYCCDDYLSVRGVCYFLTFDFSTRRHGELSVSITVSPSREKSVLAPPTDYNPSPTNVGSYSIAAFLKRPTYRWDLVDVDASTKATCKEFGIPHIPLLDHAAADVWKPSSYALPFDRIADEAIADVNEKLRLYVLPKLEITLKS